jgi:hypothetical protein
MVECILCYGGPAEQWGPLPATRLASRKIITEQNITKGRGPALWVLCGCGNEIKLLVFPVGLPCFTVHSRLYTSRISVDETNYCNSVKFRDCLSIINEQNYKAVLTSTRYSHCLSMVPKDMVVDQGYLQKPGVSRMK